MLHNKTKTRGEKLKFLNDLKNGKASVKDILPTKFDVWIVIKDYDTEGSTKEYRNMKTGQVLSESEYESRIEKSGIRPIIFK